MEEFVVRDCTAVPSVASTSRGAIHEGQRYLLVVSSYYFQVMMGFRIGVFIVRHEKNPETALKTV